LLPAIKAADANSAALVKDLETLSRIGRAMLNAVNKCLRRAMRRSASHGKFLCRTIDLYCQNLLTRLDKEEQEPCHWHRKLFPAKNGSKSAASSWNRKTMLQARTTRLPRDRR
jgi:hypothetical protein